MDLARPFRIKYGMAGDLSAKSNRTLIGELNATSGEPKLASWREWTARCRQRRADIAGNLGQTRAAIVLVALQSWRRRQEAA